jgi:hypothetical protein
VTGADGLRRRVRRGGFASEPAAIRARDAARGERAIAALKTSKILAKPRCCPRRATTIVQAILVLHHVQADRYAG